MFGSFSWSGAESPSSKDPEVIHPQPVNNTKADAMKKVVLERMVHDEAQHAPSLISAVPSRASFYARGAVIEVPEAATEKDQMQYEEALQAWLEVRSTWREAGTKALP